VSDNFNLDEFMRQNGGGSLLEFQQRANSMPRESQLAIHKFHRHQLGKGKTKNNGPINWQGRDLRQAGHQNEYFNQIRDPKIAAAISATHKMLAESLNVDTPFFTDSSR
jgi:hypothetical protein